MLQCGCSRRLRSTNNRMRSASCADLIVMLSNQLWSCSVTGCTPTKSLLDGAAFWITTAMALALCFLLVGSCLCHCTGHFGAGRTVCNPPDMSVRLHVHGNALVGMCVMREPILVVCVVPSVTNLVVPRVGRGALGPCIPMLATGTGMNVYVRADRGQARPCLLATAYCAWLY